MSGNKNIQQTIHSKSENRHSWNEKTENTRMFYILDSLFFYLQLKFTIYNVFWHVSKRFFNILCNMYENI